MSKGGGGGGADSVKMGVLSFAILAICSLTRSLELSRLWSPTEGTLHITHSTHIRQTSRPRGRISDNCVDYNVSISARKCIMKAIRIRIFESFVSNDFSKMFDFLLLK